MAQTISNMIELGTVAPRFALLDTISGKKLSLSDLKSDVATVVIFICNHCPYVKHINTALVEVAIKYQQKGIQFIAISSNDVETHPQDSPEKMKAVAQEQNYPFPYLYDETQEVAKAFDATCTPDFFLFDARDRLYYRGQLDDSRPGNGISTGGSDLRNAIDSLIYNRSLSVIQKPSMGCNIKWK